MTQRLRGLRASRWKPMKTLAGFVALILVAAIYRPPLVTIEQLCDGDLTSTLGYRVMSEDNSVPFTVSTHRSDNEALLSALRVETANPALSTTIEYSARVECPIPTPADDVITVCVVSSVPVRRGTVLVAAGHARDTVVTLDNCSDTATARLG